MATSLTMQGGSVGILFPDSTFQDRPIAPGIPGQICMFDAGTALPSGWFVCDGTNGTPDLRDRFILSSGSLPAGTAGGSFTISLDQMAVHSHSGVTGTESNGHTHDMGTNQASLSGGQTGGAGAHSHGVSDPGHAHNAFQINGGSGTNVGGSFYRSSNTTAGSGTGISLQGVGDHTHTFSGTVTVSGSTGVENSGHTHSLAAQGSGAEYFQPYYALIFAKFIG